jgi:CubicO group peptidase (beta-lactamase class C family)
MSLENYMEKHVWGPLGITSMTFHPEKRPELLATIPEMSARQGGLNMFGTVADTEAKVAWIDDKVWALHIPDDNGGAGCYGRATDYVKVLRSITADDGKLLGSSMLEELFKPQLSESAKEYVAELRKIKELNDIQGLSVPETIKTDHSLGGVVVVEDVEGRRRNGTMFWAGLPNVFWWADRKGGLCGIYASQVRQNLPFCPYFFGRRTRRESLRAFPRSRLLKV